METGQMIMMSQMPAGAKIPAAQPAPSTAATVPMGDQKAGGDFAGILLGVSPSISGQPVTMAGADKTISPAAPDTAGEAAVTVQSEVKPDLLAMLLASVGGGMGNSPPIAAGADDKRDVPQEQEKQDAQMLQNVAIWAAGTLLVQPQTDNGRMPETGKLEYQAGGVVEPNSSVVGLAGATASMKYISNQEGIPSAQNLIGKDVPGSLADSGVFAGLPSQQSENSAPLEKGPVQLQTENVVPGATSPLQPVSIGAEPKPATQAVAEKAEVIAALPQAPGIETKGTPAEASVTSEAGRNLETPISRGVMAPGSRPATVHADAGAERLTEVSVVAVPNASETSVDQSQIVDGAKEATKPHEVVLSRSSVAEAALAGNQQRVEQASEKPVVMAESGLKAGFVSQVADGDDNLADSSGSFGKKSDGFMPKSADTSTTITQQIPGGHQTFSTEAPSSTSSLPVQPDTPRPVSHEQVAGQVREQLANHDLKPGSDQITFKLSPDHLGDIKVNLSLNDQSLKVEIVAETRAARDSLLQHVDSLKESLARQNVSVEKFDVTTGGGSAGSQGNNAQGEWRELARNRQSQQWLSSGGYRTPSVETLPSLPMYQAQTEHAMVDLHF